MRNFRQATYLLIVCILSCCYEGQLLAQNVTAPPAKERKDQLEVEKLVVEVEKLREEVDGLKVVGPTMRWIGSLVGPIIGAVIGGIAVFAGYLFSRRFNTTQQTKLEQDKDLSREQHNIALFQNLGHKNVRVQLAAAAMLIQRLQLLYRYREEKKLSDPEELERNSIAQGLIAVTKEILSHEGNNINVTYSQNDQEHSKSNNTQIIPTHPALMKYIADNLVKSMSAVIKEGETPRLKSPLEEYDFQKAQLADVYWARVDARGVDFYQANFHHASLKNANLSGAIFYQADLSDAVLTEANLEGANLYEANLEGTILQGATYNQSTTLPPRPNFQEAGAIEVG